MFGATPSERAYFAPFFVFLALLALGGAGAHVFEGFSFWMVSAPRYWVYPLQTVVCGGLLVRFWTSYHFQWPRPSAAIISIACGVGAFLLWIAPQQWLGQAPRRDGFDPSFFGSGAYAANLLFRGLRLVIVVPLVEEIFWRGFLLRYLIREDFLRIPIGAFTWLSFAVVTIGFTLEHAIPDWPAAALTGALYNLVAYRTRSLSACVLTHAVTNALLGGFVLRTGQWGFW